jgi:hypothetical protein
VPFGIVALVLVAVAVWGVGRAIRNRRLAGPRRGGTLPPLRTRTRA